MPTVVKCGRVAIGVLDRRSHRDHRDDVLEPHQIPRVPGVQRQAKRSRGRRDQQIGHAGATGTTGRLRGGKYACVRPSRVGVERERVPGRGGPLQTILATRAFCIIVRRVRSRRQLGERDRGDGGLVRQQVGVDEIVIHDDGGVEQSRGSCQSWATGSATASKSTRKSARSTRGARRAAAAIALRGTNRRGGMGRNSAIGVPLRVTVMICPPCTSRRTAAESLRSSRWVMTRLMAAL